MPDRFRPMVTLLEDRVVPSGPGSTTVSVASLTHAAENGASGSFRVTRVGDLSLPLTINYAISGTATSGTDFNPMGTSVTLPATYAYADIFVDPVPDNLVEGTETVIFTVGTGTAYTPTGSPATVNITDDPAIISVTATNTTEGGSAGGFTFTRTGGAQGQALTVSYTVGGTATSGDDYTALSGSVTFAANSSTANVTLTPVNDSVAEYDEGVVVTVSDTTTYKAGANYEAVAIIHDNETPLVTITTATDALEGIYDGQFMLTRKGNLSSSLTVSFSVSGTATSGTDYTALGTSVTFAAGAPDAYVDVITSTDSTYDPNETVTVTLQSGSGYTLDTVTAATVVIEDAKPSVSVETLAAAYEYGINGLVQFTRTGDLSASLTVNFSVGGTATSGTDYTSIGTSVTFATDAATALVTLVPTNDTSTDPDEVVTLTIQTASTYEVGSPSIATVLIVDDESPIVSVVKLADAFEGGANGLVRFSRTGSTSSSLTISYSVSGTATAGTDYTSLSGSVTFATGAAVVDVAIAPTNDTTNESVETVIVTVTSGTGYGTDPHAVDVVSIVDDDTSNGQIGGVLWFDDGDGIRETGENVASDISVELLDQWGNFLYRTLTGSTGEYLFRGLIASTVLVQFYSPMLLNVTTANQGSDESKDSDANVLTGRTNPITLTTGAMTNLLLGAGFAAGAEPERLDLTVEIRDRFSNLVGADQHLRVAKWEGAFEDDPAKPGTPRLRGQGPIETLGNGFDFIDRDDDRFAVWVRDVTAWGTAANNTPTITVKLSTLKADNTVDDDATTISLTRIPDKNGWYWSDSQLLVSNTVDDGYADPKYLGKDDAAPAEATNTKGRFTYQISDRTHKIALGGKVKAVYTKNGMHYPSAMPSVKLEKTVKLNVTTLTGVDVAADVTRMREIYAQVGIWVDYTTQAKDPPPGVNLADGLDVYAKVVDGIIVMAAEDKALLGHAAYRTNTMNGKDDIEVYYVNFLKPDIEGASYWAAAVPDPKYKYSAILAKQHGYTTLAHEAMHVLINSGAHVGGATPTAVQRTNLLVSGAEAIEDGTLIDSRRLTAMQQTAMHGTVAALLQ